MDELTTKKLSGTDGAAQPFFSPDGKWIGFVSFNDMKLKKIPIEGGAPVTLHDMTNMAGASWGADDTIVFSSFPNEILRISASGGTPETLVKSSDNLIYPQILPDGKALLYTTYKANNTQPRIMVQPPKSGKSKELLPGFSGRYVPTGHIIYWPPNGGTYNAVPFDLDRLEITGKPFPLGVDIAYAAISDSGTLVYTPITSLSAVPGVALVWVNREGKEESLGAPVNSYSQPKISPDGTRVALSMGPGMNKDIWIWDIARKTLSKLTFDKTREITPIWSPDGKWIAYWADTRGVSPNGVYRKPADGTGDAEKLISAPNPRQLHLFSWSGDGKALLMQEMVTWTNMDICTLTMIGDHTKNPLLQTEYSESQPIISPDGRWIAYSSNETTGAPLKTEVYVRPFPEVNKGKWQISTGGGNCPLWSPDGRELFYLSEDGNAMSVAVESKPTLRFGAPKVLFKNTNLGLTVTSGHPWDIHPDGKRFLMMEPPPAASSEEKPKPKIIVVTNWFEELRQRTPVK
jgi:serine/threonine-protein kinase